MSPQRRSPVFFPALLKTMLLAAAACLTLAAPARADMEARLKTVLNDIPADKVPGVILLVEGPDAALLELRGVADRKTNAPLRAGHLIRAASVGKTYVAALAVMAEAEGLLDLDETIDRHLSADVLENLPQGPCPTMRQLLNHTSGVPEYFTAKFYLTWKKTEAPTTEQVLREIRGKRAVVAPGEAFSYSNTNYYIAALVLERVYGEPLSALLQTRIFDPLGLEKTYYNAAFPPGDDIRGYGAELRSWKDTYEWRENHGPDGGVKASPEDLARWIRALFAPNGALAQTGAVMTANPARESDRKFQGLGVEILQSRSGERVYGHTGDLYGYLTAAFYAPNTDTVFVLHMNRRDHAIFRAALGEILSIVIGEARE